MICVCAQLIYTLLTPHAPPRQVEKTVNDHNISKRALGSTAISAMREQGRVLLRDLATSIRLRGKDDAADWRARAGPKRAEPENEEGTRRTNRSRVATLFTLGAARLVAARPGGQARFAAALASAYQRRRTAGPSNSETAAFERRIAAERARQAVRKTARQEARRKAELAGKEARPEPPDFAASVVAAASGLSVVHLQPSLFRLFKLGSKSYPRASRCPPPT